MEFVSELEARINQYTAEAEQLRVRLAQLESLISHAKALREEEYRSSQIPLQIAPTPVNGEIPTISSNVGNPQPVSEAIYSMLHEGPTRYSEMVRRIPQEFPKVHVKHVNKGVHSALRHGMKVGRIKRLGRGVYTLVK